MAMEREIIFSDEVEWYLEDLTILLFEQGYFGYPETAKAYVAKIVLFMTTNIGIHPGRIAPSYFSQYGPNLEYIRYPANKHTSWYGFYQQVVNRFYVWHITNNHIAAQYF
ncbi:hypothetical protein SAMD00024442_48_9 [Candidatus Symbiothrix dinenymphae]|nr:hypothetical protein SAMD00024442_48_9 [Candidatus Symbiothrix dinenymphae]